MPMVDEVRTDRSACVCAPPRLSLTCMLQALRGGYARYSRQYEQKSCALQLHTLSPGSAMDTGLFCSQARQRSMLPVCFATQDFLQH